MEMNEIVLSRGIYQMIKSHLKQDTKLTDFNQRKLNMELKSAKVMSAKSIDATVVSINSKVKIRDVETEQEYAFELVPPAEAKNKNMKMSVLSPLGLALVGYKEGEEVQWEMPDGLKTYRIEKVDTN